MSYNPASPKKALGFIQATAVSSATVNTVPFDVPNDMETTESGEKTELFAGSIVLMTYSRSNDGSTSRSSAYHVVSTETDLRYRGRIPGEIANYFQSSEYAFDFTDNIKPYQVNTIGSGNVDFTNYSHCRIWRLV